MKANKVLGALLFVGAAGLGLAAIAPAEALAQPKKGKKEAAPTVAAEPPQIKKPLRVDPKTLQMGMSPKQVAGVIDQLIDDSYKEQYKKVSPGVQMRALDAQVAEEKSAFLRSRLDFKNLPLGLDGGPLRGEYTYNNRESIMTFTSREGKKRHFFFIQDKLWKIIDEYKLSESSGLGKDFATAITKLNEKFGVPGRVLTADPSKNRFADEVDWKDNAYHLRVIKRNDEALGIAYEDLATLANLSSLRTAKPQEEASVDPAIASATRKPNEPPGPAPDASKDKGKAKPKQ